MTRIEKAKNYIKDKHLTQRNRLRYFTERRQVVYNILREEGLTLKKIGNIMERDHATVLHNLRAYDNNIKYKEFRDFVDLVYLEGDLFKEQKPDKVKSLTEKVLTCENFWQMRRLQEELKQEIEKDKRYGSNN